MSIYLKTSGDPQAQPLLLLHGWGMSSAIWHDWLAALEARFYVLQLDLPGLGQSRWDDATPYTLEAVAEQIETVLMQRLQRPVIWLGWSLGGVIAATLAQRNPGLTRGLITLATNPCFVVRDDWADAMEVETFEGFQHALQQSPSKTLNRFAMLQVQGDPQARPLLRQLKGVINALEIEQLRLADSLALLSGDYRALFRALGCPRLHLFGREDALVPADVARQPLLAADSDVIAGSGHLPFLSAPTALNNSLDRWLEQLDG